MLVFPKIKCLYMPVCKVATNSFIDYFSVVMYGTTPRSIVKAKPELKPFEIRKKIHHNFNIEWSPEFLTTKEYKNYYKIAFVRNPWTRSVAAFRELIRRKPFGYTGQDERGGLSYQKIYDLMQGYVSFENFIDFIVNIERDHTKTVNAHWRTHVESLHITKGLVYDFIGKLENVDDDLRHAQEHLGLETIKLKEKHVTSTYNYKLYYNDTKTIDLVGEYYKEDIEKFGYEFK